MMSKTPFRGTVPVWLLAFSSFLFALQLCEGGIPTEPEFFALQFVNHLTAALASPASVNDDRSQKHKTKNGDGRNYWKQRYYSHSKYFQGPGHPILVVLGGEGAIPPSTGIIYPVVANVYAKAWGALVLEPEHRFYGESQPISQRTLDDARRQGLPDPRIQLLTPEQALYDIVRLTRFVQTNQGCSFDSASPHYCPVITIGGSYSGFLSAMARLRFPHIVDMAYAASAPMKFYSQQVDQYAYYNHISSVADAAVPGCAGAVQTTLQAFSEHIYSHCTSSEDLIQASLRIGVCPDTLPTYMANNVTTFINEIIMVVAYTFANQNMAYYPPSNHTSLARSCHTFWNPLTKCPLEKLKQFLIDSLAPPNAPNATACFDLSLQLPTGPNATLSAGDWSGVGTGTSGESWDFQTCTSLVEAIGMGPDSMFRPLRPWSLDWLSEHCQSRFVGVTPQPQKLVHQWQFKAEDLPRLTSHILFTNGLNDGWSVSGIQTNLSDTLVALNFPNGAHHSDLNGVGPNKDDTLDIIQGYGQVQQLLTLWLESLPSYQVRQQQQEHQQEQEGQRQQYQQMLETETDLTATRV